MGPANRGLMFGMVGVRLLSSRSMKQLRVVFLGATAERSSEPLGIRARP